MSDHVSNNFINLGEESGKQDATNACWILLVAFDEVLEERDKFRKDSACLQAEIKWIESPEIQGFAGL